MGIIIPAKIPRTALPPGQTRLTEHGYHLTGAYIGTAGSNLQCKVVPALVHPGAQALLAHDKAPLDLLIFRGMVHGCIVLTDTDSSQVLRHAPTEEQLWSYAAQLAAALRAVHSAGLPCRAAALHPSKVLLVSPGRIRIGGLPHQTYIMPAA